MKNFFKKIKEFVKKWRKVLLFYTFALFFCITMSFMANDFNPNREPATVEYWEFSQMVEDGNVSLVEYGLDLSYFVFYDAQGVAYISGNPRTDDFKMWLYENEIPVVEIVEGYDILGGIFSLLQVVIIYGFLFFMMTRMMPGQKKDKYLAITPNMTFDDIAGYDETKKNMEFLVKFLKDDSKVKEMGARVPKGVVLYGPPGTGKTLMAKALAGTAGVPFFSATGSDFVEMYVGLGASRIRSLFQEAKKAAPCIVFIDEIDAVGTKRGQGHSEKDQTINALLAELDGFNGSEGIITICATNRLEDLDSALIRPGRFDRQVAIPLPDKNDRIAILKVHAKNKKIDESVNFETLANMMVGFSGATIESLLNEAAIIAVTENAEFINFSHIDQAFFKIVMKGEKKEHSKDNDYNIRVAAYHEAGHALATKLFTKDKVPKVTVIGSTSGAGGVTFRTPAKEGFQSKNDMENMIKVLYAGRAAESLYFKDPNDITMGASNDIQQATSLIRKYLTTFGMSQRMGLINLDYFRSESGVDLGSNSEVLLNEATELSEKMFKIVRDALEENYNILEDIAQQLIEKESLENDDLDAIIAKHKNL